MTLVHDSLVKCLPFDQRCGIKLKVRRARRFHATEDQRRLPSLSQCPLEVVDIQLRHLSDLVSAEGDERNNEDGRSALGRVHGNMNSMLLPHSRMVSTACSCSFVFHCMSALPGKRLISVNKADVDQGETWPVTAASD